MRARVFVTTRAGGRSRPPYDSNNLALHVGDDARVVQANRARLAKQIGVGRVTYMQQVHGRNVATLQAPTNDDVDDVDALVTDQPGVAVAVLVADCVPVAIVGAHAVGVAHAGRRGIASGIVRATVDAIRALDDGGLVATIGPSVCGRCYEVPAAMHDEFVRDAPAAASMTARGTPALDLPAAVRHQLHDSGVEVRDEPHICTMEDDGFYSHRRDGVTGRFAMVAMLER